MPENSKSFVGYVKGGFDMENHKSLFNKIKEMGKRNVKFIMNNSNTEMVNNEFKE